MVSADALTADDVFLGNCDFPELVTKFVQKVEGRLGVFARKEQALDIGISGLDLGRTCTLVSA